MTNSFKRLQTRGWHGYLMERFYRDTVTHHRRTRRPKDIMSRGYAELVGFEAHRHIYKRAADIAILRRRWRSAVASAMAEYHTESLFDSDIDQSRFSKLLSTCQPAGVVFHTKIKWWITCGKYFVCPFCRYRKALKVLDWLEPFRQQAVKIASVSYLHEYSMDYLPVWDLIRSRLRKRRNWICDYVLHAPAYDAGDRAWFIRTSIIVMWDGETPLFDPQALVPANDPRAKALRTCGSWTVSRPTKKGLVDAVCAGLHYAPETLDFGQTFPGRLFINLARLTSVCRCGGTPGRLQAPAFNIAPRKTGVA